MAQQLRSRGRLAVALAASAIVVWLLVGQQSPTAAAQTNFVGGSPSRPERDRTKEDTVDTEDSVILQIAVRLNVHPAVVCIKWAVQNGQATVPFSVKRHQFESTLDAVCADPLSDDDMQAIAKIDKNCRLIKGQVRLW